MWDDRHLNLGTYGWSPQHCIVLRFSIPGQYALVLACSCLYSVFLRSHAVLVYKFVLSNLKLSSGEQGTPSAALHHPPNTFTSIRPVGVLNTRKHTKCTGLKLGIRAKSSSFHPYVHQIVEITYSS